LTYLYRGVQKNPRGKLRRRDRKSRERYCGREDRDLSSQMSSATPSKHQKLAETEKTKPDENKKEQFTGNKRELECPSKKKLPHIKTGKHRRRFAAAHTNYGTP